MKTNAELSRVEISENIQAIANCIQDAISGRPAGPQLIEWCRNNQDKLAEVGFHNYNCVAGVVTFDQRKEDEFDAILDIIQPLKLR